MSNYYNIDKNKHYFILMHPLEGIAGLFYFTSSSSREQWVECEIVEEQYKVDDGYKIELRALDPAYGKETYYQSDFVSLIKSGHIIEKTSDKQVVKEVIWHEQLCGNTYLVHSAFVVEEE